MTKISRPRSSPNVAISQVKYTDPNPLLRFANQRFFGAIDSLLEPLSVGTVLYAGCGEGVILDRLNGRIGEHVFGMDLDRARLSHGNPVMPSRSLVVGDIHQLPFATASFDLVLVLEVFEHVGDPQLALREAFRVGQRYLLASVPNEPWWRIGNMLRLKYLRQWGNTPEHIQHWNVWGFRRFIASLFSIVKLKTPFLWTFVLARKPERK